MSVEDEHRGIRLHVGCGAEVNEGFIGLDIVKHEGVEIVHDLEDFPYPIYDGECHIILAKQILEHLKPWKTIDVFNEFWRIMKVGGQLVISTPYAGSPMYWQDPTHCNGFTELTFKYFDKRYKAWGVYKPKPWRIDPGFPSWTPIGIVEIVMTKVAGDE